MKKKRVLVIGDLILDQYKEGNVSRISPESPVPIVKFFENRNTLGGAANVANNLIELGCEVIIAGMIGKDDAGRSILQILKNKNIDTSLVRIGERFHTLTKVRIIGNQQQIVRIDYNDDESPRKSDCEEIYIMCKKELPNVDIVILSDYGKGICSKILCRNMISSCAYYNKNILIDPKGIDWDKYRGATLLTPNLNELSLYLGKEVENSENVIIAECKELCKILDIKYLLITRSAKGMLLISEKDSTQFDTRTKEVFDVSGAGDTVVSAIGAFYEKDEMIEETIKLSNIAAGIVVGKRGTATVTYAEIQQVLSDEHTTRIESKIVNIEKLDKLSDQWKKMGEKVVFTNGCFDVFHKGHAYIINMAATFGDKLIVAINSDQSVKRLKGELRPINGESDRAYVIASLTYVDYVIIFEEDTPEYLLSKICPDVLVKGGDYSVDQILGRQFVKQIEIIPFVEGYSTTNIIERAGKSNEFR